MSLFRLLHRALTPRPLALSGDLAVFASPLSILPPREEVRGFFLGLDDIGREVYINPAALPSMHGIIVGTTGSGKSTLARHLVLEAIEQGIPAWVIDPHGERSYRRLFTIGIDLGEDKVNIFHAPGWQVSELAGELASYLEHVYSLRGARFHFRELLRRCFENLSLDELARYDHLPEVKRLREDLEKLHGEGGATIDSLAEKSMYFTFPKLFSREFKELASLILLLLLQGYRRTLGERHRLELMVILEEAHFLAPYLLDLYKEVRKFGYGVIAVTQLPRELDPLLYQLAGFVIALSGTESYVNDISLLFSLTPDERDHILYKVHGAALLVRQGDPRPRKVMLKPRREALAQE